MSAPLRWQAGSPEVRALVEAWWRESLDADHSSEVIDETVHRRAIRLTGPLGRLLVKHFRSGTGPHPLRERAKASLGRGASGREGRALARAAAVGVPVPRALGLARTAAGDSLLVLEWIEAPTLWRLLENERRPVRALLLEAADAVAALHAAGLAHGDLHPGNLLMAKHGPVFIDLQRAGAARRGGRRQLRDLGLLDYSLAQLGVSRTDRLRVLQRALSRADLPLRERRARARRAIVAAEKMRAEQTRVRARRDRRPAQGSHWTGWTR